MINAILGLSIGFILSGGAALLGNYTGGRAR